MAPCLMECLGHPDIAVTEAPARENNFSAASPKTRLRGGGVVENVFFCTVSSSAKPASQWTVRRSPETWAGSPILSSLQW